MNRPESAAIAEVVDLLGREKASAILRTGDPDKARPAMDAAIRGGFKVIEFTLTTPGALDLIEEYSKRPDLAVGAGTVLSVNDAREAVRRGARFLVSPVTDEEVIAAARALDVACMPGTHTPTEMFRAHRAGAPLQKLFPAAAGGPAYVRACLGPLPHLRIVPTNGVDETNAENYFAAGAFAAGFVAPLFVPDLMDRGDWDAIEERARILRRAVSGS